MYHISGTRSFFYEKLCCGSESDNDTESALFVSKSKEIYWPFETSFMQFYVVLGNRIEELMSGLLKFCFL